MSDSTLGFECQSQWKSHHHIHHVSNPLLSELTLMVREGLYLYIWQKAFLLSVSNLMYAICMMDSEETSKGTELTFKENNLF